MNKIYLLLYKKYIRFDFDDQSKIVGVRYKNLTKITIKVQVFWAFIIWNVTFFKNEPFMSYFFIQKNVGLAKSHAKIA